MLRAEALLDIEGAQAGRVVRYNVSWRRVAVMVCVVGREAKIWPWWIVLGFIGLLSC